MGNIMHHKDFSQLLSAYIHICNEALTKNKDNFPFNQLWQALKDKCQNRVVNIALIDDKPEPICSLSIAEAGVMICEAQKNTHHQDCHIKLSHIKHVLENKEAYIKDPALIDWHWIETMLENYKSPQG